jgi:alkaline phosphatase
MAEYALAILEKSSPKGFFMVIEEEGTDNFSNQHNASGLIEAGLRAEEALKFLSDYSKKQPNVLLLVASDSDASGIQAVGWGPRSNRKFSTKNGEMISPRRSRYGSPYDGVSGTATAVFRAKPDRKGQALPFVIAWATEQDTYGGVVVKAQGPGSDRVRGTLDNTDIYRILYLSLFGKWLE